MPTGYILIHLLLIAFCVWIAARVRDRRCLSVMLGSSWILIVITGFVVERRSDLAWAAMGLGWTDAVFFSNLSLQGVAVLAVPLWRAARDRPARVRAAILTLAALGAGLWSLRWLFAPVPPDLAGRLNAQGFCRQTTPQSCGAAAAVTLLNQYGIETTEAEMARLCLTRDGFGTTPLGMFRGVAMRTREAGLRPRLVHSDPRKGISAVTTPCLVSVGLHPAAPPEVAQELEGYGWAPGLRHAVVILSVDSAGQTLRVADPSYGLEDWPVRGLEWIWDGRALVLKR